MKRKKTSDSDTGNLNGAPHTDSEACNTFHVDNLADNDSVVRGNKNTDFNLERFRNLNSISTNQNAIDDNKVNDKGQMINVVDNRTIVRSDKQNDKK